MPDRNLSHISLFILLFILLLEGRAEDHLRLFIALMLAWPVATFAFYSGWLTLEGRLAAVVVGTITLGLGGWVAAGLLVLFFLSSSLLSRPEGKKIRDEASPAIPAGEGSARRDGSQVWANGFWVVALSAVWFLRAEPIWLAGIAGALAVSTADTWASELGRASGGRTIRITDLKPVSPGAEGGVSLIGTLAAFAGAALIALSFLLLTGILSLTHFLLISAAGLTGCMADSYLGALFERARGPRAVRSLRSVLGRHRISNLINWAAAGCGVLVVALFSRLIT